MAGAVMDADRNGLAALGVVLAGLVFERRARG